jgi:hypothetical protein
MAQRFIGRIALATLIAASAACSDGKDDAPPVATPMVTLASSKVPLGRQVAVTYRFSVAPNAPPFAEDYLVFVHVMNASGKQVWTNDHEPPTPTRQWKPGTVIEYTQPMFVPRTGNLGHFTVEVGLYSPKSRERLPLSGDNRGRRTYRVAEFDVTGATRDTPVLFVDGWHNAETPDSAQGVEWRWSKGTSTVWLRNPKRDVVLVIDADQPATALGAPQRVTLRIGDKDVDMFEIPPGKRLMHRVALPAASLGESEMTRVTLVVDKTFVPANLPGGGSSDKRELGIRVFNAYLEPAQP